MLLALFLSKRNTAKQTVQGDVYRVFMTLYNDAHDTSPDLGTVLVVLYFVVVNFYIIIIKNIEVHVTILPYMGTYHVI